MGNASTDPIELAQYLHNQAAKFGDRYSRTGWLADLEKAIKFIREAIEVLPPDHFAVTGSLAALAVRLDDRYRGLPLLRYDGGQP